MNEDELNLEEGQEPESQEQEQEFEFNWDIPDPKEDPNKPLLDRLENLERLLTGNQDTLTEWEKQQKANEERLLQQIDQRIAPILNEVQRPKMVNDLASKIAQGLDDSAKDYLKNYFEEEGYTVDALQALSQSKATVNLLRQAAMGASGKKQSAPKSTASNNNPGDVEDRIDLDKARAIAAASGRSVDEVVKIMKEEYKNAV